LCFDLSIFELFVPLSKGGKVTIVSNLLQQGDMPESAGTTLINTVPSVMNESLRLKEMPETLQTVNMAGEGLPPWLAKKIYEETRATRLVNLYGPTEDTTYSTCMEIKRGEEDRLSIGYPVSNSQLYVLDEGMGFQPVGVAGE